MVTFISHSPDETLQLGKTWATPAAAGWLIGLTGDLGSGKTQLVKGLALGLQCNARVHSPTFTLLHHYAGGRLPLHHLDLYRLAKPEDIAGAGLEEYLLRPPGITVVEWIERWLPNPLTISSPAWPLPATTRFRRVVIEITGETQRRIAYEDIGP